MHVAQRIRETALPPIDVMRARAAELRARGVALIDLGQAVPGFPAAPGIVEAARGALDEPSTHGYSADAGLPALRAALAATLARDSGVHLDPHSEMIVTASGSQAFLMALLTLLEPGDRVLLPSPYFFNHEMAVRIAGGVPVEVPLSEESGYRLRLRDVGPYLDRPARALVVVSPNNPTGAVFDADELRQVGLAAAKCGVALVTDETYQDFAYGAARHLSLASLPELRGQVLLTRSYSKTFGIAGWRLGMLAGPADFIREAMKVQDSMVICAPVIAQKAVLGALQAPADELKRRLAVLDQRRRFLAARLAEVPRLQWRATEGALFAFVRVEGCADSQALALDVLRSVHVLTIAGRAFGAHGEGCLRLSYGSADLPDLEEACRRLERYFASP